LYYIRYILNNCHDKSGVETFAQEALLLSKFHHLQVVLTFGS